VVSDVRSGGRVRFSGDQPEDHPDDRRDHCQDPIEPSAPDSAVHVYPYVDAQGGVRAHDDHGKWPRQDPHAPMMRKKIDETRIVRR
jgi:hypothetical protein